MPLLSICRRHMGSSCFLYRPPGGLMKQTIFPLALIDVTYTSSSIIFHSAFQSHVLQIYFFFFLYRSAHQYFLQPCRDFMAVILRLLLPSAHLCLFCSLVRATSNLTLFYRSRVYVGYDQGVMSSLLTVRCSFLSFDQQLISGIGADF